MDVPRLHLAALPACAVLGAALAGCGGTGHATTVKTRASARVAAAACASPATCPSIAPPPNVRRPPVLLPAYPEVLDVARRSGPTGFVSAVRWRGQTVVWVARSSSGAALLSFNQHFVGLALHSGTVDAGGSGWKWGAAIAGPERRRVVAAFNGGFKFSTGAGGFESGGRVALPMHARLGSIVTYAGGYTDIGSWGQEVPTPGRRVVAVRQNLGLLIDQRTPAATAGCDSCWGATLGGVSAPARSALGITADGRLIWAGAESATVSQLTDALLAAHVVRAVELDINPEWVAGYLFGHRRGGALLGPTPVVPGQNGIPGMFLVPYSRDFFSVLTR